MKFQKLTAGLLALSMLCTPSAGAVQMLTAAAEETEAAPTSGTCGENVTWKLDESTGTLTISGTGEMDNYDIYNSSPWYSNKLKISSAIIADGVTSIGDEALAYCYNLTSVTIPDSVTSIGRFAFSCTDLPSVTIPDSVTIIGVSAFSSCNKLTEITIPDSVTIIRDWAFFHCESLTDITILNPECKINDANSTICNGYYDSVFTGTIHGYANSTAQAYAEKYSYTFKSLDDAPDAPTSGTCGENVTWKLDESTGTLTISGTGAMEDYKWDNVAPWVTSDLEVKSVIIEDGVTSIGNEAFYCCYDLTSITIPDSVTSIGDRAFYETPWLTAKQEEDPLVVVNDIVIDGKTCSGDVTIPDGVTCIAGCAFSDCTSLTGITIPDGVTCIGNEAFANCISLTGITIPDKVTSIEPCTFQGCTSLTDITIPDSVTSIGRSAFSYCTSLPSVTIPDSVTSIEVGAFDHCENLTEITILNPDCEIYPSDNTISNGLNEEYNVYYSGVIRGYDNSTAQTYAGLYGYTFESLGNAPDKPDAPALAVGNVNGDAEIDASDAADLLIALASIGAGADSGLTAAQEKAADADGNGTLDAGDAATILQYAAYLGSGGTGTLTDFLNN